METQCLTTTHVEDLQRAWLRGRPVRPFIESLTDATLAALVEYGCLRRLRPELPPLPPAVQRTVAGQRLNEVVSEIGLRNAGNSAVASLAFHAQEAEFLTVVDAAAATSEPVAMFVIRFANAAKAAGFPTDTANELQAAFNEMIENAVQHANSPIPTLAGYHYQPAVINFVVADVGRGVRASLSENPQYASLATDGDAIALALRDGVSRFIDRGGNGFRPIFKALADHWGQLRFRSRNGCWTLDGTHADADHGTLHCPPELPGFQVSVTCRLNGSSHTPAT